MRGGGDSQLAEKWSWLSSQHEDATSALLLSPLSRQAATQLLPSSVAQGKSAVGLSVAQRVGGSAPPPLGCLLFPEDYLFNS